MKKSIKKLTINKTTISNLGKPEMSKIEGGATNGVHCTNFCDSERRCTKGCHSYFC